MQVLVINSGSSSVKFEVFDMEPARSLMRGEVERIGDPDSSVWVERSDSGGGVCEAASAKRDERPVAARDHYEALGVVIDVLGGRDSPVAVADLVAIGHRVVHGGDRFTRPTLIDDGVVAGIRELAVLAPLHTKANVAGIEAARAWFPEAAHVAVFDTTFHHTMPFHAREYALPRALAQEHGIRRYGFHGTSHSYVARRAAWMLGRPLEELALITLHLGNGASIAAIKGGKSIDTSMGMTPLEGLVMGTRCGDVDPAVPMLLGEITGRTREDVHRLLNFESGLKGLSGVSDMREVHRLADAGDRDAQRALEMFCYRAKKYLGAYYAVLGRVDAVVFTAGIGEHDADVRARICGGLERLGIEIDQAANEKAPAGPEARERFISVAGAEVAVLVIPADEELEIARAAFACRSETIGTREPGPGTRGDE